mmetsp:Transcript_4153/g.6352  ORF Transcript_4153/g.6352 Transcript_4153/m.6352 type:complete len:1971 (+) Transcript_4153:47-5959(+)
MTAEVNNRLWSLEEESSLTQVFNAKNIDGALTQIHKLYEEGDDDTILKAMHALTKPDLRGAIVRSVLLPVQESQATNGVGNKEKHVIHFLVRAACCDSFISVVENDVTAAKQRLDQVGQSCPRLVCQYVFRRNDIVWICRSCQADETCVMCNACYLDSDHTGHDVYFYHAQAGGCCDCGDADAWNPLGFCSKHGAQSRTSDPLSEAPFGLIQGTRRTLIECRRAILLSSAASTAAFAKWGQDNTPVEKDDEATEAARFAAIELARSAGLSAIGLENILKSVKSKDNCTLMLYKDDVHVINDLGASLSAVLGLEAREASAIARTAQERGEAVLRTGDNRNQLEALAQVLRQRGILATVRSNSSALWSQRAKGVVLWLHALAKTSDALCRLVCEILDLAALVALLRADSRLPKELATALHALYLTLMADQQFKRIIATAYAQAYLSVTADYARGLGLVDASLYTLSVQFLNRATFVSDLVKYHNLLYTLGISLYNTLNAASSQIDSSAQTRLIEPESRRALTVFLRTGRQEHIDSGQNAQQTNDMTSSEKNLVSQQMQDINNFSVLISCEELLQFCDTASSRRLVIMSHPILLHRRYSPIIADLKCVLNIEGMSEAFLEKCLGTWLGVLSRVHGIDPQVRRAAGQPHIEFENRDWMYAFNVNISLTSVFEFMGSWIRFASSRQHISLVNQLFHGVMDALVRRLPSTFGNQGSMDLAVPSRYRLYAGNLSFHLPLHRFLAHLFSEATKNWRLNSVMENLIMRLAQNPHIACAIADEPLCTLRLASQVRVGLWRRNGHSMNDQLMNYSETPFCRLFRDLDILMIQLIGLALSPRTICFHILERFDCNSVLSLGVTRKAENILSKPENIDEQLLLECTEEIYKTEERSEAHILLAEEILLTMIIIATELPRLPDDENEQEIEKLEPIVATGVDVGAPGAASSRRITATVRREFVHRLAYGPCTHSEIQECIQLIPKCDQMPAAAFLRILDQVAIRRPARGLEPEKLELRTECWNEYDATYFHMTPAAHQQALVSMPTATNDLPIVGPPPAEHPRFSTFRKGLLNSDVVLRAIYASLYQAAMQKRSGFYSERLVLYGLHLLTLAVHCCGDDLLRFEPSDKSLARLALSLESDSPLPCLSELLSALASTSQAEIDIRITAAANWLKNQGTAMNITKQIVTKKATEKNKIPLSSEQRKLRARERALALMKRKSEAFASVLEKEEESKGKNSPQPMATLPEVSTKPEWVAEYESASEPYAAVREIAAPTTNELCIVCREAATASRPLGYAGLALRSRVLLNDPDVHLLGTTSATTVDTLNNGRRRSSFPRRRRRDYQHLSEGLFVRQCGHALHYDCFDDYFATVVQRSEAQNNVFLDVKAREFQCPLCKALSNVVVPALSTAQSISVPHAPPSPETPDRDNKSSAKRKNRPDESADSDSEAEARCTTAMTSVFLQNPQSLTDEIAVCYDQASIDRDVPAIASSPREEHDKIQLVSSLASFVKHGITVRNTKEVPFETADQAVTRFCAVIAELHDGGNTRPPRTSLDISTLDPLATAISCTVSNLEAEAYADDEALATLERDLKRTARLADALRYAITSGNSKLRHELQAALVKSITPIDIETESSSLSKVQNNPVHDDDDTYAMAVEQDDDAREPQSPSPDFLTVLGNNPRKRHRIGEERPQVLRPLLRSDCLTMLVLALALGVDDATVAQLLRLLALAVAVQCIYIDEDTHEDKSISHAQLALFSIEVDLFLRRAALVLDCFGRLAVVRKDYAHPSNIIRAPEFRAACATWRAYLGIPPLAALLEDSTISALVKNWTLRAGQDTCDISLPRTARSRLIQLPESYTQLHTLINIDDNDDDHIDHSVHHPAVCLVCGQVFSADGSGHCTRHALECGAGSGIFFLLQECTLLLIYKNRAAYFASPYADAFGERQGHFRGRPLFLDHDRHHDISRLWGNHGVPDAVIQSRFTSRQIIVPAYY